MRVTILALTLCLAGCGGYTFQPPGANNAPGKVAPASALTPDQRKKFDADMAVIVADAEKEGTRIGGPEFGQDQRKYIGLLINDIKADLECIFVQNEALAQKDRLRLLSNKINERDRAWRAEVDAKANAGK